MVETTAYALLTFLSLKDINYVNPIIKWLSEEQRYGGGFYSTQVTFLYLVLSSWRHLSCHPHPTHYMFHTHSDLRAFVHQMSIPQI